MRRLPTCTGSMTSDMTFPWSTSWGLSFFSRSEMGPLPLIILEVEGTTSTETLGG